MKRAVVSFLFAICLLLLVRCLADATPAILATGVCGNASGAASCTTGNITAASGNTIIVMYSIKVTTSTGNAPTTSGSTFKLINGCAENDSTTTRVECWATTAGGSGTLSAQGVVCQLSANSALSCLVLVYSGVVQIGTVSVGTASTNNPSAPSISTHDSLDTCLSFYSTAGSSTVFSTTTSGTLELQKLQGSLNAGAVDLNLSSPGICTTTITYTASNWALASIELRTSSLPSTSASTTETGYRPTDVSKGLGTHFSKTVEVTSVLGLKTSDQTSGLGAHFATPKESVVMRDIATGLGAHFATPQENLIVYDLAAGLQHISSVAYTANTYETFVVIDKATGFGVHFATPIDELATADMAASLGAHFATPQETVIGRDMPIGLSSHFAAVVEVYTPLFAPKDSMLGMAAHFATTQENIHVQDMGLGQAAHFAVAQEQSSFLDQALGNAGIVRSVSETLSNSDQVSNRVSRVRVLVENIAVHDSVKLLQLAPPTPISNVYTYWSRNVSLVYKNQVARIRTYMARQTILSYVLRVLILVVHP